LASEISGSNAVFSPGRATEPAAGGR